MISNQKKLSINKLAEYLDAHACRRAAIVRQQKKNLAHPAQYYSLAQAAMSRILVSAAPDEQFEREKMLIAKHSGWGTHPGQLKQNNLHALEGLIRCAEKKGIFLWEETFRKPVQPLNPRQYSDVRLSNRFDIEFVASGKKQLYGGIKFYLNKEHPLTAFSGAVLAAMLQEAAIELFGKKAISPKNGIMIMDAFQGEIFLLPIHSKRYLAEAVAAAKEFSLHWDAIGIV